MKKLSLLFLVSTLIPFSAKSQIITDADQINLLPIVNSHDPNLQEFPEKSFYESKNDWQYIIDTTWGPGLPLAQKKQIFNTYVAKLDDEFDGFESLGFTQITWDSLVSHYDTLIDSNTSRGRFSALMNYFSIALKDWHTYAFANEVFSAPLNPGVPLLHITAYGEWRHAGAVVTVTPDSTIIVVRVAPNHPLNLQPGDIVLGYNDVKWIDLLNELMEAELPIFPTGGGSETSNNDAMYVGSIMNWHLFDTIDILKYATGDTVHLDLTPMISFNPPSMANNEQMPIPGIQFPPPPYPDFNTEPISYGIIDNTNIGYIYIFHHFDNQMNNKIRVAIDSLKNTDGLIIDMRHTYGGWGPQIWQEAFGILANDDIYIMQDAFRCSPNNWTLCLTGDSVSSRVAGVPPNKYERPIALLTGPFCMSMGDRNANRLSHLENVRTFGKPICGSLGANLAINNFPDWSINYSIQDFALVSDHTHFLNRRELPIDYPIWHNKDDVAQGKDAVVEAALDWMNNLVYGHFVTTDSSHYFPGNGVVNVSATIENPNSNNVTARVFIENLENTFIDSIDLVPTKSSEIWQGAWITPNVEDIYKINIKTIDNTLGKSFTFSNMQRFTTAGPIVLTDYYFTLLDTIPGAGDLMRCKISLKNQSSTYTIPDVKATIDCDDTLVTITSDFFTFEDLLPGEEKEGSGLLMFELNENCPNNYTIAFRVNIKSEGWDYWLDDFDIVTDVNDIEQIPSEFSLEQNFPNPFNPITIIKYGLAERSFVDLRIYDILGREVESLVNEQQNAGFYRLEFNATRLSSGIYFYRFQARDFVETKKMILMK
jgi:hypothetical protein